MTPEGTLHAVVLRSPMANATFTLGDLDAARTAPGVHLVLTGADVADMGADALRRLADPAGRLHA